MAIDPRHAERASYLDLCESSSAGRQRNPSAWWRGTVMSFRKTLLRGSRQSDGGRVRAQNVSPIWGPPDNSQRGVGRLLLGPRGLVKWHLQRHVKSPLPPCRWWRLLVAASFPSSKPILSAMILLHCRPAQSILTSRHQEEADTNHQARGAGRGKRCKDSSSIVSKSSMLQAWAVCATSRASSLSRGLCLMTS